MAFDTNYEETLQNIAESIELPDSNLKRLQDSYNAILNLLKYDPFFSAYEDKIEIFPQGSVRLGTTIKSKKTDFDLDLVIHINIPYTSYSFNTIHQKLFDVLQKDGTYEDKVHKSNRCVTVDYENNYHMDLLPALTYNYKTGSLAVPDREAADWTISNPEGFAKWFLSIADRILMTENFDRSLDLAQFTKSKERPLKNAIKIIKMYRDEYYIGKLEELKIPSIIITYLAACSYKSTSTIYDTVMNFISFCKRGIEANTIRTFHNPIEPLESYSERWEDNPLIYSGFSNFLDELEKKIRKIASETNNVLREDFIKSMVSMENYNSGLIHFSENQKRIRKENNNFESLKKLAEPKTSFHKPYFVKK
ncbi:MAG: nucleotidyltransferase [Treponema sp.]|nr:nucleotidyltransferase [Treponema sp.]MEE3436146.1 nucleotidyltransferase [Treponema sp.]